ncbi:MAG: divergent polysaccharide deacetylase family protein, partial [Alphaproteobacteria bacterium]|nr:divergent polysaccharide deacetylase family protein [Alphaproteobacteria bacterium]
TAPRKSTTGAPAASPTTTKPTAPKANGPASLARTVGAIGGRFGGRANPLGGSLNAIGGAAQDDSAGLVIPSVTSVTLRSIPQEKGGKPLGPAPDARLIEKKEGLTGALPVTAKDGEVSWKAYARPVDEDIKGKRVGIVIMGFGLSRASGMAAIGKLPAPVTLALDPYARDLSDWLVRARLVGHEVMMTLPMESERFPIQDAGPYSLDTSLKAEDNIKRLELVLSQVTGYFGVATVMGSRFGTSEALLTPVLQALKDRGLMLLATGSQTSLLAPKLARKIRLPLVVSDITLDDVPSRAGVEAQLLRLEGILKEKNTAVAVAQAYPATISRLNSWIKTLAGKKITLVPVSALIEKRPEE